MNADYQFDDENKSLPLWNVKHQNPLFRESRRPFYKHSNIVRAANRKEAIEKIQNFFSGHDRFSAGKLQPAQS